MSDVFTREKRSMVMSKIRGHDTKIEVLVRKWLFKRGYRYRKNDPKLPGHPDIVLPKYKTVIFVHGCFWHHHDGCKYAYIPKTNVEFWKSKIYGNVERDRRNINKLTSMGWKVLVVWECELKKNAEERLNLLLEQINTGPKS